MTNDRGPTEERDGVRVHDIRFADDAEAFLVEPIEGGRGAAVLFLHWFAAGEPKEMHAYDADHGVRDPQAAADRSAFLNVILDRWAV